MAQNRNKAAGESDVTSPGTEQELRFDDKTLKAIAEVYNNEGNEAFSKKDYTNAVYFYTEGIKVDCKNEDLKAELYSNRATAHLSLGNYSDSLTDAKEATDIRPLLIKPIIAGASASVKLNLFEQAITWCDTGLLIDKEITTLLELRNLAADKANSTGGTDDKGSKGKYGLHDRTSTTVSRFSSLDLGAAAFKRSDFKTARDYFELELNEAKVAENRDREGKAYTKLGVVYDSLGNFRKAIEFQQQALSIAREIGNKDSEGIAYIHLGNAYDSLGDFKKAIELHQQGLSIAKEIGNKDSEGKAYMNLGNTYDSLGDFKKAIEFQQLALGIAKGIGNKDSEGKAHMNLGNVYDSLGDFKKAIEFQQLALSIAEEVGNIDSKGKAYMNLGNAYHSLGDVKKAVEFHQQALGIAKEIGNKHSEGGACMNLGNAYHSLGEFEKAIHFHQQALSIAKKIGNKDSEGKAHMNLGNAYDSLGDVKKAIEFHQQALKIAKEIGNKDSEGKAYMNLGNMYDSLGDFEKAIDFHQQGLSIAEEIGNKASEGNAYSNLGNEYLSLGDFKKAIEVHQRALSIAKEIGNRNLEGCSYINLGNAYQSLGDAEKAVAFLHQGLSIAEMIGNRDLEGSTYANLGNAYQSLRDFEKAIEFHQRALSIAKEIGNKNSEGSTYGNLGNVCRCLGDYNKAIEFHQQALNIAKETGNKDAEGRTYGSLGSAYEYLGDFEQEIEFYRKALTIAKETGNKRTEQQAYASLGFAFNRLNDLPKAEEFLEASIKLFEEMRFLLQEKDEWKISFRDECKIYMDLWMVQLLQDKTIEALVTAERGRAQALADLMESQYGIKSTLQEQTERRTNILSHSSTTTAFLADVPKLLNLWVLLKGHEYQFIGKEIDYTLEYLTDNAYRQIGVHKSVRCEDRSLDDPEDERIEELSDGGKDEEELSSSQAECDPLKTLYDVVIAPFSHLIDGDELIIVPDGSSFLIPYAALVDQGSRYLSETLRIRLAPSLTSLRLLAECPEGRHSTSGALLVGDPWIETVRFNGKKYEQLPGAEDEVKIIGQILNVEPLTGKNATKEHVLSRLNSVSLVHIAAHGRVETGEIILSPNLGSSERPKEKDFLLTMADVLNANLDAKLVVLSCCHSGRGKIKAEGVVGITRAFLGAGARSVIASLWAIDDEATLAFMSHFYEHLVKGQSASKSLHQAMKWMRESDDFNAVKYWAPFVLIGDDVTLNFGQ